MSSLSFAVYIALIISIVYRNINLLVSVKWSTEKDVARDILSKHKLNLFLASCALQNSDCFNGHSSHSSEDLFVALKSSSIVLALVLDSSTMRVLIMKMNALEMFLRWIIKIGPISKARKFFFNAIQHMEFQCTQIHVLQVFKVFFAPSMNIWTFLIKKTSKACNLLYRACHITKVFRMLNYIKFMMLEEELSLSTSARSSNAGSRGNTLSTEEWSFSLSFPLLPNTWKLVNCLDFREVENLLDIKDFHLVFIFRRQIVSCIENLSLAGTYQFPVFLVMTDSIPL